MSETMAATRWRVEVTIMPKEGVNDPQGDSVEGGLRALGFHEASDVRVGKMIALSVQARDTVEAEARVVAMCDRLLANPVIESYSIAVSGEVDDVNETANA